MKKLLLTLATFGLGALAYAMLRSELESSASLAPARDTDEGDGAGEARRCEAVTRSGERCAREAEPGSSFCWQHGG